MFKIKYVGPRPIISQHGISYKDGKEDKYVYLVSALNLLHAIDHEYINKSSYSSIPQIEILKEPEIHQILQQYDTHLEDKVNEESGTTPNDTVPMNRKDTLTHQQINERNETPNNTELKGNEGIQSDQDLRQSKGTPQDKTIKESIHKSIQPRWIIVVVLSLFFMLDC